jgi:hypothetical protein
MVKKMKNATIRHDGMVTTITTKHEKVMKCLKVIKQKFFKMKIKKETWHAKSINLASEVQLLKEQKQSSMQANKTCKNILLEKI